VLREGDGDELVLTLKTCLIGTPNVANRGQLHICEASCSTILWAAIGNFTDECGVIELGVMLAMELLIADWRGWRVTVTAWRNLVVKVQVLGAAIFSYTVLATTTMPCEHLETIGVTFVVAISQVVLVMMATWCMTRNPHSLRITLLSTRIGCVIPCASKGHRMNLRPLSLMVDLDADGVTMLVILLSGNIDALFSATLGEKFFLGVLVQKNVNIAFDFLGCRPINLAILLKALLLLDDHLISVPASDLALLIFDCACA